MSDIPKDSLKERLLKLQCHFTWNLLGEDVDIDHVEERLNDQIVFLPDAYKHRIYNLLAYLKHLKGDHDGALLQLQKAEAQIQESGTSEDTDFKRTVMYGNFAWVFYHLNRLIKSCTYVKKVETILKKYEPSPMQKTLLVDIYGEQGWTYLSFTGAYYRRGIECFERALALDPEDPDLNSGYAMAVYRVENFSFIKNPPNKCIQLLERAVKLNPSDTVMKTNLAMKYLEVKKQEQGNMLIQQALQEQPESPYVLRYVGTFYRKSGQMQKAIAILKKALSLTPTSCAVHYQLAMCYQRLLKMSRTQDSQYTEDLSNAIFHSEKALELNKSSVAAHILLANVYIRAHEFQKAEELFGKTLTINHIRCEQKQELHFHWAQYFKNFRKSESDAGRHYKEALKIQSQTIFRGNAIRELKSLARTMIFENSMDATGYALIGFLHQQIGQDTSALTYYEKALLLEPDNQEYLEACSALQATLS